MLREERGGNDAKNRFRGSASVSNVRAAAPELSDHHGLVGPFAPERLLVGGAREGFAAVRRPVPDRRVNLPYAHALP